MKHFTLAEMLRTGTNLPNVPTWEVVDNLRALIENVLIPAREALGAPIHVNSGYRSPEVNKAVGGAKNSQHVLGEAADLTTGTKEGNKLLFQALLKVSMFDQLIDEKDFSWIHVSFRKGKNRLEVLKIV